MKYTITLECDNPTELFEMASRLNGGIDQSWPDTAEGPGEIQVVTTLTAPDEGTTPEANENNDVTPETPDEEITPDSEEAPSIDDVRAAMVAYTKANSRDVAIELLGQFVPAGEKAVLSNVPEEDYAALITRAS